MKNIIYLLIIISIYCDLKYPWEWSFFNNITNNVVNIVDKIKTVTPMYINELQEQCSLFQSYTEEKKDEIIEIAKYQLQMLSKKIQNEKTKYIKSFLEKATEISKYISLKICKLSNSESYEKCIKYKKNVFSKLLMILKEELQCSEIIRLIQTNLLSDDIEQNIKYILFLLKSITINTDALKKGKSMIIYDAVNCLNNKFEKYWPKIFNNLKDKSFNYAFSLKFDLTNLISKLISNLIDIIHFEEKEGYIQKANQKTGLISNKYTKVIYSNIFKALSKLSEFGNNFYNISSKLSLKVTINPGNLDVNMDGEFSIIDFKERGIRIKLHSNYMLRITGAYSLQTVVFDSPFVSLRGRKENDGGISQTFVGITLYDKNGKEIFVKDIEIDMFRPILYFKQKLFKGKTKCLYYNQKENKIENKGIQNGFENLDDEEYIKCIPNHLNSFSVGSFNEAIIEDSSINKNAIILSLLNVFLLLVF